MKTIRLFEAFAGIGSQYQALKNIANQKGWKIEVVGIIEWFIPAIIAYEAIHYSNPSKLIKEQKFNSDKYVNLSNDSKRAISSNQYNKLTLTKSTIGYWLNKSKERSNNAFDIKNFSWGGGKRR